MREFVEMLRDVENVRQDVKLSTLARSKKRVGFFSPATDKNYFFTGVQLCESLQKQGVNIIYMCVMDEVVEEFSKHNISLNLIKMSDLDELRKADEIIVWNVYSVWAMCMYTYFEKHGMSTYIVEDDNAFWMKRNWFYDHIAELYDVYADLSDEYSKRTFMGIVRANMTGQLREYIMALEPQYMLHGYAPQKDDIVVDGGAYDGGTAADFMKFGSKVYAFEMDKVNYEIANKRGIQDGFEVINKGLWSNPGTIRYMTNDAGSMVSDNGDGVAEFIDIDSWMVSEGLKKIDFIKMDIEGAELEALKGAAKTICACKPRLAICAYHKLEDLYTLQKYIKSLRTDYEFAFRHYPINGYLFLDEQLRAIYKHYDINMQIPCIWEYVLYAR